MKSLRLPLALIIAAFALLPSASAEETKPAGEPAFCCKKSAEAEKACTHGCCVTAAKEKKNCEKCGGKNSPKTDQAS